MRRIETLNENQVFVFGSNENGYHAGGAARQALDRFGAVWGKAKGLQGQSYAIVTLDEDMRQVPPSYILEQLTELNEFAGRNPDKEFLMTLIGCGIAGFRVEDIWFSDSSDVRHAEKNTVKQILEFLKEYENCNKELS